MPESLASEPAEVDASTSLEDVSTPVGDSNAQPSSVETPVDDVGSTGDQEKAAGPLSADLKAHMEELKSTNPKLADKIASAIRRESIFQKEFPGGIKEARAIKQLADQIGGEEGIAAIQTQLSEIEELDRLWEAKDPKAIQNMVEDYPEQFSALMPNALEAWVKADPDGFNRTACGIISNTFQAPTIEGHSFSNLLWMLTQTLELGNVEGSKAIVSAIGQWSKGFAAAAAAEKKAPETVQNKDRVTELETQLASEKTAAFNAAVGARVEATVDQRIERAISPYLKGRTLTDGQRETLNAKIVENLAARLEADRQFNDARKKFSAASDQEGLVKFSLAKIDQLLPGVVKTSYRWLFGGGKPKPAAAKPNQATAATQGKPPAKGWVKIGSRPGPHDIDRSQSPIEMLMKNSAIMKDGRKVYWGDQPYKG